MVPLIRFQVFLYAVIAVVWALGGQTSATEPLRLVYDLYLGPPGGIRDDKSPGIGVETVKQVFATMGQDVSVEALPTNRLWMSIIRGESDGIFPSSRVSGLEQICSFPDEPLTRTEFVLFVRAADVGKLKFSSFDDLVGHNVAAREADPGFFGRPVASPEMPPEMWEFLRGNHILVETTSSAESFRMLIAGHVDYAVADVKFGRRLLAKMGLSEQVEPLLSRTVMEDSHYVCFSKARVSPSLVNAFSGVLKQFRQTDAYQALIRKYFP
jgi:polar amino acid transport system substrate-binding protein